MGIIKKILNTKIVKEIEHKTISENAVPLKNVLIANRSVAVGLNGSHVLISNIISPSSLPIESMNYEVKISTTSTISASTSVTTNPIENIFKSFSLRSNPSAKSFYDLDGTLSEMSLFQRYLKIDGEFNQSTSLVLDNSASTTATAITQSGTWNYKSDFSISPYDAGQSGLSLILDLNAPLEFYANSTDATSISVSVDINVYATYVDHDFQEVELIKTTIPIATTGIARIGYLLAQGKKVLSQWINYGSDANITDISFSADGGRNYLYNKMPFSNLVTKEQLEYKNSLTIDNVFLSGQSKLNGVNNLFMPLFVSTPLVYIELNFNTLPLAQGYEVSGSTIVANASTKLTNEIILYQIVLRE